MSVDIATLGIAIDSTQTQAATKALDDFTKKGGEAEDQTKKLTKATEDLSDKQKDSGKATSFLQDLINKAKSYGSELEKIKEQTKATAEASVSKGGEGATEELGKFEEAIKAAKEGVTKFASEAVGLEEILGADIAEAATEAAASLVGGLAVGLGVVVVGLGVAAAAAYTYSEALENFEKAATFSNTALGQTAQGLEDIAERSSKASGQTVGATREQVLAFTKAGIDSSSAIEQLSATTQKYADLSGQTVPEALKELAATFSDPNKALHDLDESYHLLSATQYAHIEQLIKIGDGEQATSELTKIWTDNINKNEAAVSTWTSALRATKAVFSELYAGLGSLINRADEWYKATSRGITVAQLQQEEADKAAKARGTAQDNEALSNGRQILAQDDFQGIGKITDLKTKATAVEIAYQAALRQHDPISAQLRVQEQAYTDTLEAQRSATGNVVLAGVRYMDTQQRLARIATISAQEAALGHDKVANAARGRLEREKSLLSSSTELMTADERETRATIAANSATNRYVAAKKGQTDQVAKHLSQLSAEVEGQEKYNDSIGTGVAAELKATATKAAAVEMAGKHYTALQAEKEETLQLALALDKYVGKAREAAAETNKKATFQSNANDAVGAGLTNVAGGALQATIAAQTDGLRDALKLAGPEGSAAYKAITQAIKETIDATMRLTDASNDNKLLSGIESNVTAKNLATSKLARVGSNATDQAVGNARDQAQATIDAMPTDARGTAEDQKRFVDSAGEAAAATVKLNNAQSAFNDNLKATHDRLVEIADATKSAGEIFGDAFGKGGKGIASMVDSLADGIAKQQEYKDEYKKVLDQYTDDSADSAKERATAEARYARQSRQSTLSTIDSAISATKNLFNEHSKAYKAMEAIEKVYAAVRLAIQIKDLVMQATLTTARVTGSATAIAADTAHTGVSVANSGIRATADGVAAFAKTLASLPFPLNIAAGAAVLAALVAVGVKIAGGGGGKASAAAQDDNQDIKPFDYSSQNSSYSVNDPDASYGGNANNNNGGYGVNNTNNLTTSGDTHYILNSSVNMSGVTSMDDFNAALDQRDQDLLTQARQAAANDRAESNRRQRIG